MLIYIDGGKIIVIIVFEFGLYTYLVKQENIFQQRLQPTNADCMSFWLLEQFSVSVTTIYIINYK